MGDNREIDWAWLCHTLQVPVEVTVPVQASGFSTRCSVGVSDVQ